MQTKKVILRTKKGRGSDYREIEIPTDDALIDVVRPFHGGKEPQSAKVDGWTVKYTPPTPLFTGPSWDIFAGGRPHGPMQLIGHAPALCVVGNREWFATFAWDDDTDPIPRKVRTTEGVLAGRPVALQESLLDWRPTPRPALGPSEEADASESEIGESSEPELGEDLHEGARLRVTTDRYERDPVARARCLDHYGSACSICGMDFATMYGDAAAGFIHVHHLLPLSADGDDHPVDPIADLRPLCPNCHSFVHLREPPIGLEEAKGIVEVLRQLRDNDDVPS